MKHLALCVGLAFGLVGCFDPDYGGGPVVGSDPCLQFTSCGTCTPVLGCGWCSTGNTGMCVSEPNECWMAPTFEWTWEFSGCPAGDAGASTDAGTTGHAGDAGLETVPDAAAGDADAAPG
jgi:Plexin repeat